MKNFIILFSFFVFFSAKSQIISSSRWSDLFSYNNVLVIKEDEGRLIAATENGIFYYNISTGEITKLSKANGLHEVKITAFDYDSQTKIGLVGYKNGSMDIITPDGITMVVDIPIANGFNGDKKINHISINGNKAVVSVAYGVSIFNLERKEFGDTCFFMNSGSFVSANESIIKDGKVYSVTNNGLMMHEMSNVTFPVFSSWTNVLSGSFTQISNGDIMVVASTNQVFRGDGSTFSPVSGSFTSVNDVSVTGNEFLVIDNTYIKNYSSTGGLTRQKDFSEKLNTGYNKGQFFAGSQFSGVKDESDNTYKPDGPYNNASYKMDIYQNQLLISSGGLSSYNGPVVRDLGYYHFDGSKWNYPEYFVDNPINFNVLDAVFNPSNPSQIFFANYTLSAGQGGVYKMENNEFVKAYPTNSINGDYDRLIGLSFDSNNQLIGSICLIQGNLKTGYLYYNPSSDNFSKVAVNLIFRSLKPLLKEGVMYIPHNRGGLLMYDYNNTITSSSDDRYIVIDSNNNLPDDTSLSIAIDKNDDAWIGTENGLRVLSNPKEAITEENPQTDEIIIEENGIGEELFRDTAVLQIAVDSGNQKWISADGGGVFYLSSSGEETFQHFTKSNSPLPTNSVTDIKVDEASGKVYFVTLDGIVVYQGDVVNANENFGDVLVYPNPVVYANYKGNVRIRGLAQKTNIRITDAAGNLVHQAIARGGFYEWNLQNQRGVRVASGIYYVLMTNEDATDTATAKIAVVN